MRVLLLTTTLRLYKSLVDNQTVYVIYNIAVPCNYLQNHLRVRVIYNIAV